MVLEIISREVRKNILPLPFQYIKEKMKRSITIFSLLLAFASALSSCSTKVDLYADYKDIPIVSGLIDVTQDTNYVKIIRAFSGSNDASVDANEVAMIPDSNNYPGKLDVKFYEYKSLNSGSSYSPTGRVIELDTMTIHDKNQGVFYAPDQKLYFAKDHFNSNDQARNIRYKYRLEILKGDDTISASTGVVGGRSDDFKIINSTVDMNPENTTSSEVTFYSAENAYIYEIKMQFNYKEKLPGQEMKNKCVEWSLGTFHKDDIPSEILGSHIKYKLNYSHTALFNQLESKIDPNILNAERYIGDFYILIAAGGSELYNYIEVSSPSSSIAQTVSDYTNIDGGFGVLSSRVNISKNVNLSAKTIEALMAKENWGFKQDLGE